MFTATPVFGCSDASEVLQQPNYIMQHKKPQENLGDISQNSQILQAVLMQKANFLLPLVLNVAAIINCNYIGCMIGQVYFSLHYSTVGLQRGAW